MAYLEVVSPYLVYFTNPMHLKYDKRGALCIEWLIRLVPFVLSGLIRLVPFVLIEWPYKMGTTV